jgi:hypothetical protein
MHVKPVVQPNAAKHRQPPNAAEHRRTPPNTAEHRLDSA